ncbi:DUF7344 domain-containing protein [Natrinema limicola]|uniref:DUF7344 domain-containing protein n=1 Tax=Natrinema limicola JCM 13563 TaxID=1230457 RepID=M0CKZ4_9EURY|nr:hypothetical protein [Natrinema limicola]ELZ23926.1 hypothetical protein C476_04235 [Natrinema limicola JCM 13563]
MAEPPSVDERYRLLASQRRRLVLEHLAGRANPVDLTALASAIATREQNHDTGHECVGHVAISLHHVHLPMLSQFGLLEYDAGATRIGSCPSRADARALTAL